MCFSFSIEDWRAPMKSIHHTGIFHTSIRLIMFNLSLYFVLLAVEEKVLKERDSKMSDFGAKLDNNSQDSVEKQKAVLEQEKAKQERSLLREKDKEKQKGKKRGMDVDVVTRFTTSSSKPKKAKEEEVEKVVAEKEEDDKQAGM